MTHLALIDSAAFMYRAYHVASKDMVRADGTPVGAINQLCAMLWRIVNHQLASATHIVVVGDAGGVTFRHRVYSLYKANRGPMEPGMREQMRMLPDAIDAFDLPYVVIDGIEADDIIASYVRQAGNVLEADHAPMVTIVSQDKDLYQLVTDKVRMFDPNLDRHIGFAEVVDKFGVRPDQMVDYLALVGDASDNVPGVPGIGAKRAASLLLTFETIDGIYENLETVASFSFGPSMQANLVDNHLQLMRSRFLVKLKGDCLVPDFEEYPTFVRRNDKLIVFCQQNGCYDLARRIELGWTQ